MGEGGPGDSGPAGHPGHPGAVDPGFGAFRGQIPSSGPKVQTTARGPGSPTPGPSAGLTARGGWDMMGWDGGEGMIGDSVTLLQQVA